MDSHLYVRALCSFRTWFGGAVPLEATLHFYTADPFAINVEFAMLNGPVSWVMSLELFEEALRRGCACPQKGDIHFIMDESAQLFEVRLRRPEGVATVVFALSDIQRFVARALARATTEARAAYIEGGINDFHDFLRDDPQ